MNPPDYTVRRATVDDLGSLIKLWDNGGLIAPELEKRVTEFQVVVDPAGQLIGAVGLRIAEKDGLVHSEAFLKPEYEAECRTKLWARIMSAAKNHGLFRLWTQQDALFWHKSGFKSVDDTELKKLPKAFTKMGLWRLFWLREEAFESKLAEQEFELFRMEQAEAARRTNKMATALKAAAWIIAFAFLIFVGKMMFDVMQHNGGPGDNMLKLLNKQH